jgi:ribonuclease PH
MGKTKVLCVASVENHVPPHAQEKGTGWIHAEYAMLPRAGRERTPRGRASGGGRAQEISRLIGRSLRAGFDLSALGPRSITVDCDVIIADGGTRTASINGAFVAVVQALRTLRKQNEFPSWPVRDYLAAVSVGISGGKMVLDLSAEEDVGADVDFNVVMTGSGKYVEVQGTAEGLPFSKENLSRMLALAKQGIAQVVAHQKKVLGPLSAGHGGRA